MTIFVEQRRQKFAVDAHANFWREYLSSRISKRQTELPGGDSIEERRSLGAADIADDSYCLISLNYTAGKPIEPLRSELESVVVAYERYMLALREYEQDPNYPVFGFQEIAHFERMMQLVGLAYLLHRRDLIPRLHGLIADSAYDGVDAVYEELVGHVLPDRPYLEHWYHQLPYQHLLNATDEPTPEGRTTELNAYCLAWYRAMEEAPWHDSHLRIDGNDGDYFGYWAFEAGAIALLYDIDDSSIKHMVYPKDLVAWSRSFQSESAAPAPAPTRLRIEAGQPCPQAGWWVTPAKANSQRYFQFGDVMPALGGDYGLTIWEWDADQVMPKL